MVGVQMLMVDDRANNLEVGYALLADLPKLIRATVTVRTKSTKLTICERTRGRVECSKTRSNCSSCL